MDRVNFEDVTLTLNNLNKGMGEIATAPLLYPRVNLNSVLSTPISGLSLAPARYLVNIRYDQDIFSELPIRVFDESYNLQMARFMKPFKERFIERLREYDRKFNSKLSYTVDDAEHTENIRLTSEWQEGNAMLYLSFDRNPADSSFGLIWNDNKKKNFQTRSGNLSLNSQAEIIHEIVDFVYRVY